MIPQLISEIIDETVNKNDKLRETRMQQILHIQPCSVTWDKHTNHTKRSCNYINSHFFRTTLIQVSDNFTFY